MLINYNVNGDAQFKLSMCIMKKVFLFYCNFFFVIRFAFVIAYVGR